MEAYILDGDYVHVIGFSAYPENFAEHALLFDAILASYTIGMP